MKILKHPIFEECTCERCGTVFQTDVNDPYEIVFYGKDSFGWRIDCPLCHEWCDLDWAGRVNASDATDTNVGIKSEWISVDERLPEENTRVLGYSRLLDEICCYDITKDTTEIHWWTEDSGWYRASELNITHWMPLPETPKGD